MAIQFAERLTRSTSDSVPAARTDLSRDIGLLVLRVVTGVIFVGHGSQKLFGAFHGEGLSGTAKGFEALGYSPGKPLALLAGLGEMGGGLLLIVGLATSFGGAAIVATMFGALAVKMDLGHGAFFAQNGGYEYELMLTVLAFSLVLVGAGRFSLDHGRPWDKARYRYAFAAGAVVVGLITALSK